MIWLFASGVGGSLAAAAFPPPPDPRITPGVDKSSAMNVVWLGFDSPKKHEAPEARVEQAALSPESRAAPESRQDAESEPAEPETAEPAETEPETEPETQTKPAESQSAEAETPETDSHQAEQTEADTPESRPEQEAVTDAGLTAPEHAEQPLPTEPPIPEAKRAITLPGESSEADATEGETAEGGPPEIAAKQEPETSPRPEHPESADASAAGPSAERPDTGESREESRIDGARSDAESPATSTDRPVRITPGLVIAREGVQVSTRVPPRFSIPTELLASRASVHVRVSFDARGDVVNVEVLRSSGHPGVDQEWVNALYRWKATGEALEELDPDNPRSVHRMEFNVSR